MADNDDIFYAAEDDADERFEVLSIVIGDPEDVMQWCETDVLWKAEAVFELLEPHFKRFGHAHLTLRDRWADEVVRSVD
jgi:hypothetical protein